MRRFLLWFVLPGIALGLCAGGVALWYWQDMQSSLDRRIFLHESSELFSIERGSTLASLARRMETAGWIKSATYLRLEARRLEIGGAIKAGLYEIRDGETPRKLLEKFVRGDVKTFRITFIEGATFHDMLTTLAGDPNVVHTLAGSDFAGIVAQTAPGIEHPEGWYFPSTYLFSHGDTDTDILRRAHERMVSILDAEWESRAPDLPYNDARDALIMASIIEKETGRADERAEIAGVFARRLRRGMKLQTDPTVIYGLGESFDGNLRRVDLRTDTPYNTYTRFGLPPGPIALPGEASIHAALNPAAGDSLYFVGRGDGSHQFSKSLTEHNAAVRRYQLSGAGRGQ